jgi:hypothetical protein
MYKADEKNFHNFNKEIVMFQKIDWFFLSHFEKGVCHPLQRLTGETNYYYAGLCSFLIVFTSLGVYFDIFPKELVGENSLILDRDHPTRFWIGVFIFTNYFALVWKMSETYAYDRISHGLANPNKVNLLYRFIRLNSIITTPFFVLLPIPGIQIYDKVFNLLLTLFIFLVACDPLPLCTGKVKEWLKSFVRKPALAATKTGE